MLRVGRPRTAAAMAHGLPARVDLAPAVHSGKLVRRQGTSAEGGPWRQGASAEGGPWRRTSAEGGRAPSRLATIHKGTYRH